MAWKVVASRCLLENKFFSIREDSCMLPNGKTIPYYCLGMNDWAMVVAFTPDKKIVLERQYRHPTGETNIELPAGEIKKGESCLAGIKREFLEETGYELTEAKKIAEWYVLSGKSDCKTTLFVGKAGKKSKRNCEETEEIEIFLKPAKEAVKMALSGRIRASHYVAAILAAKEKCPEYFR